MTGKTNSKSCVVLMVTLLLGVSGQATADFQFGNVLNTGKPVCSQHPEETATVSGDGLEMIFLSGRPDGRGSTDLWTSKRTSRSAPWRAPVNLGAPVNTAGMEMGPSLSHDGLSLYFLGFNRPGGGLGRSDIMVTKRNTTSSPWGTPVNVGAPVNTSGADVWPSISKDGLSLFFSSTRTSGSDIYRIYESKRSSKHSPWGTPVLLGPTVNMAISDHPSIAPNGLILFFASNRPGGYGGLDLWMVTRATTNDPWGAAINLGPTVNTSVDETIPCISGDGSTLYFCDNYKSTAHRLGGVGITDIWQVPISSIIDLNDDGIINAGDMSVMVDHWHTDNALSDIAPPPFGDGSVNALDLIVLSEHLFEDKRLIAHWMLDEIERDVAYDSAAENDAFVLGEAEWLPADGQIEGALQLDGIDDYITTPQLLNPAEDIFSVFVWVKGSVTGQVIVSQEDGTDWLLTDAQGRLMTDLKKSGGRAKGVSLSSETVITDGNWHRLGFTWDGTNRIHYVDDIEVARDTLAGLNSADGGLRIGTGSKLAEGSFWEGLIDDVQIYDRAIAP